MVRQAGVKPISSVETGCEAILNLILGEGLNSGQFFNGTRPARADAQAYDARARDRLRALSVELTSV